MEVRTLGINDRFLISVSVMSMITMSQIRGPLYMSFLHIQWNAVNTDTNRTCHSVLHYPGVHALRKYVTDTSFIDTRV